MTGGKRKVGSDLQISLRKQHLLMSWIDEPQPDYLEDQCDELGGSRDGFIRSSPLPWRPAMILINAMNANNIKSNLPFRSHIF